MLSAFSSDSESKSSKNLEEDFWIEQTFLSESESEIIFPFKKNQQKRISNKAKNEIDRKKSMRKKQLIKKKTFESFLLKRKEQKIQIEDKEIFSDKIKEVMERFLDLLEKQNKAQYLSIIQHSQQRSLKTITSNIITNIKKFLFQNALIRDINIFNNIGLEKKPTIKKTTLNNNEIFICSRSSITGKEKFEIIFSVDKTNSINYIGIIKITNSKKK